MFKRFKKNKQRKHNMVEDGVHTVPTLHNGVVMFAVICFQMHKKHTYRSKITQLDILLWILYLCDLCPACPVLLLMLLQQAWL